eukprot:CAMPEP_0119053568 /NCGR_PEP_ID=MMETSP1177-20130426/74507_1 /TAXON_ID=2985 /ORGANISM="Ochromonas sp, Strain CCMP1899" /LENGTH=536 /DNA_ID=CAMNT_0007033553 /DNA_START=2755 /DNA_END=4365 /DNA_ORIENTATION=-
MSCKVIGTLIKTSSSLRMVDLRDNFISTIGVKVLMTAAEQNSTIISAVQRKAKPSSAGERTKDIDSVLMIMIEGSRETYPDIHVPGFTGDMQKPKHPLRIDLRGNQPLKGIEIIESNLDFISYKKSQINNQIDINKDKNSSTRISEGNEPIVSSKKIRAKSAGSSRTGGDRPIRVEPRTRMKSTGYAYDSDGDRNANQNLVSNAKQDGYGSDRNSYPTLMHAPNINPRRSSGYGSDSNPYTNANASSNASSKRRGSGYGSDDNPNAITITNASSKRRGSGYSSDGSANKPINKGSFELMEKEKGWNIGGNNSNYNNDRNKNSYRNIRTDTNRDYDSDNQGTGTDIYSSKNNDNGNDDKKYNVDDDKTHMMRGIAELVRGARRPATAGMVRSVRNENPLVYKNLNNINNIKNIRPVSASKIVKKNSIFNAKDKIERPKSAVFIRRKSDINIHNKTERKDDHDTDLNDDDYDYNIDNNNSDDQNDRKYERNGDNYDSDENNYKTNYNNNTTHNHNSDDDMANILKNMKARAYDPAVLF